MGHGRRPDQLAVASIIAGLTQVFLPVIAAIVAIVTGHLARRRMRRDPTLRGGGLALAGLILGYVGLVLVFGLVAWFVHDNIEQTHATRRRIDRAVTDVRPTSLGTVVADRWIDTRVNFGTTPGRDIVLASDRSSANLQQAVVTQLERAGFERSGATGWQRRVGGFVEVYVRPLESDRKSIVIGNGPPIVLPPGRAVVLLEFIG